MKIAKILMLLYLIFLIYYSLTMNITNIIVYLVFISFIILGFKGLKIDNASQYIKSNLYENTYIKRDVYKRQIYYYITFCI